MLSASGLGRAEIVMIFHPEAIQRVMQDNHKNYSKETHTFDYLSLLLGNGLLSSNGDFWLRQRRLMQPAFHHKQINALSEMIVQQTQTNPGPARIPCRIRAGGRPLPRNYEPDPGDRHPGAVRQPGAGCGRQPGRNDRLPDRATRLFGWIILFTLRPGFQPPHNRQFNTALQRLDKVIYGIIAERRKHSGEKNNLLDLLMQAQLEEDPDSEAGPQSMTDRQLRDEVVTLFLAGHETTAVNLSWTLYLISQHPEVEARLRRELDQVLAGRSPTLEDLPRLEYTRRVRDESMRLYPPAWVTERKSLGEDVLGGYRIPAGATLGHLPVCHPPPSGFWENPDSIRSGPFQPRAVRRPA